MTAKYILDEHRMPVREDDFTIWGKWFEAADRIVQKTKVGQARVSTVFLGLDHQLGSGPPVLFETMIFEVGALYDEWQFRCSTWEEAEEEHQKIVEILQDETIVDKVAKLSQL